MNYNNYSNRGGFLSTIPSVTKNIIIINLIMFLATLVNEDFMIRTFAMFFPASPLFKWWQPVTHMFMHGGFWHIFFNMYTLLMFGTMVERTIGTKKFLTFYFITGLGAVALHSGVQWIQAQHFLSAGAELSYWNILRTPTVGASGAIYGVLIGFAMLYPDAPLTLIFPPITLKAKWFVIIFAVIELATGVRGVTDGVAHFAHLGGMLFGFLLLRWWRRTGRLYRRNEWI